MQSLRDAFAKTQKPLAHAINYACADEDADACVDNVGAARGARACAGAGADTGAGARAGAGASAPVELTAEETERRKRRDAR